MSNKKVEKGKILIADDDDDCRFMLALLLESEGWQALEARDGKEAIEKVLTEQPQVLILDNRMPELTGAEVYQQLQAQGINLAVILATAHGDLEQLASSLGVTYFINKPFDIPELLCQIESAYATFLNVD